MVWIRNSILKSHFSVEKLLGRKMKRLWSKESLNLKVVFFGKRYEDFWVHIFQKDNKIQ